MNNTKQNHRTTRAGKLKTMILLLLLVTGRQAMAQDNATVQNKWQYGNYGNNFNIGVGIGYYPTLQLRVGKALIVRGFIFFEFQFVYYRFSFGEWFVFDQEDRLQFL